MSHALHTAHIALLSTQDTLPVTAGWLVVAAVMVTKWDMRRKTRKALLKLDHYQLHDIGLTRSQALEESAKPFWQA